MTKAEILSRVVARVAEDSPPIRYLEDEIYRYIDDGLDELAERTGTIVRTTLVSVGADEHIVTLPAHTLWILTLQDVTEPTQKFPIDPVHWTQIAATDRHFMTARGLRPETFAAFGSTKILLNRAYAAPGVLEVVAKAIPDALMIGQEPPVQSEFHDGLVDYGTFRCRLKEIVEGEDLGHALKGRQAFEQCLARLAGHRLDSHTNIYRKNDSPKRIQQ